MSSPMANNGICLRTDYEISKKSSPGMSDEYAGIVEPYIPVYEEGSVFSRWVMELVYTKLNDISMQWIQHSQ